MKQSSAKLRAARAQRMPVRGKQKMILRSRRYLNLEMPVRLLDTWLTPVELFYVRNHLTQPRVNLPEWRLRVSGEVNPFELTFADLEKLPQATVTNTLECAGNGRTFYRPRVRGTEWTRGAVGTATFTRPRLADRVHHPGVKAGAKQMAVHGLAEPSGERPHFIRTIPIST